MVGEWSGESRWAVWSRGTTSLPGAEAWGVWQVAPMRRPGPGVPKLPQEEFGLHQKDNGSHCIFFSTGWVVQYEGCLRKMAGVWEKEAAKVLLRKLFQTSGVGLRDTSIRLWLVTPDSFLSPSVPLSPFVLLGRKALQPVDSYPFISCMSLPGQQSVLEHPTHHTFYLCYF